MKPKDIIGLVIALAFLGTALFMLLGQNKSGPKGASANASQVEVVPVIDAKLDPNNLFEKLETGYKVRDYKQPIDLTTGLGNPAPFSQ
jgi:hypothetical protein